ADRRVIGAGEVEARPDGLRVRVDRKAARSDLRERVAAARARGGAAERAVASVEAEELAQPQQRANGSQRAEPPLADRQDLAEEDRVGRVTDRGESGGRGGVQASVLVGR